LAGVVVAAKLGGEIAARLRQPAVLGELAAGLAIGAIPHIGASNLAGDPAVALAADLGVILLLFQVGLESSLAEMRRVAPRAAGVALLGVVLPSLLGAGAAWLVLGDRVTWLVPMFVGTAMCATSVGITASVLAELGALGGEESNIILGAAVIDDVLGLLVLSVVSALAMSGVGTETIGTFASVDGGALVRVAGSAAAFIGGALVLGGWAVRGLYRVAFSLSVSHVIGSVSVAFCLVMSGLAAIAGLAPIVGAYAAGLLLDDVTLAFTHPTLNSTPRGEGVIRDDVSEQKNSTDSATARIASGLPSASASVHRIEAFVAPMVAVFGPVFFVRMGLSVNVGAMDGRAWALAAVLTVTGFLGKIGSGLGARRTTADRLTLGLGMVPRGEVGLIFAEAGVRLAPGGVALLDEKTYAAIVVAVFATTLVAPVALAARIRTLRRQAADTR